jgi:hypothetical protein
MQFRKIEDLDVTTKLFRLSPGMKYVTSSTPGGSMETQSLENAIVCECEIAGIPRTVIHAAVKTDDGWAYGGSGSRIVDGISNAEQALGLQGYTAA